MDDRWIVVTEGTLGSCVVIATCVEIAHENLTKNGVAREVRNWFTRCSPVTGLLFLR